MWRWFSGIVVLLSFAAQSSASIIVMESDDMGDGYMKRRIQAEMRKVQNDTGHAYRRQCANLQTFPRGFVGMEQKDVIALFGPKVDRKPRTFALPVYEPGVLGFSGTHATGAPVKYHTDFYEISELAAVKVFYDGSGERVRNIIFFLRIDENFPRLSDWENLKARLEWENSRLEALREWITERRKTSAKAS